MYSVYRVDGADNVTGEKVLIWLLQTLEYSRIVGMVPDRDDDDCPKKYGRVFVQFIQRQRSIQNHSVPIVVLLEAVL